MPNQVKLSRTELCIRLLLRENVVCSDGIFLFTSEMRNYLKFYQPLTICCVCILHKVIILNSYRIILCVTGQRSVLRLLCVSPYHGT